jgi:hypothetical protein
MTTADEWRQVLRRKHPAEFDQGVRDGMTLNFDGPREKGGYPRSFGQWPAEGRDSYYCGYDIGRTLRLRETPDATPDKGPNPYAAYAASSMRRRK